MNRHTSGKAPGIRSRSAEYWQRYLKAGGLTTPALDLYHLTFDEDVSLRARVTKIRVYRYR